MRPPPTFPGQGSRMSDKSPDDLENELRRIAAEADACSILRPIRTYRTTGNLRRQLTATGVALERVSEGLVAKMNAPFSGPMLAAGAGKPPIIGNALMRHLRLQQAWSSASASLDRQRAFSLAVFGLYVAILGLVVAIVALILPLRGAASN